MTCGKVYHKLLNNYLTKYGDFRERLQAIRDDQERIMRFKLPRIEQRSRKNNSNLNLSKKNLHKKCDPLLPKPCCQLKNLSFGINRMNFDELEKLMQAENFPDNIFPDNDEPRSSIEQETDFTDANDSFDDDDHHQQESKQFTVSLKPLYSKTSIDRSISKHSKQSSTNLLSNSHKSMPTSDLGTTLQLTSSSLNLTRSSSANPYAKLLERLHQADKIKLKNLDRKPSHMNSSVDNSIQKLLSFLRNLDHVTDDPNESNILDENTLLNLFSVDYHLALSIFAPTNIHELDKIPKSIQNSLKNTSSNSEILSRIERKPSSNKQKGLNSRDFNTLSHVNKSKLDSNDDSNKSNSVNQNDELNSKLYNSYGVKTFKDFLIENKKSSRLPKLFHDIDQWKQKEKHIHP